MDSCQLAMVFNSTTKIVMGDSGHGCCCKFFEVNLLTLANNIHKTYIQINLSKSKNLLDLNIIF